jgi:hypothetical protein
MEILDHCPPRPNALVVIVIPVLHALKEIEELKELIVVNDT